MNKIAYCGFDCTKCPLYLLSKGNLDKVERERITVKLLEEYKELKREDLYCEGCKSNGKLFPYCNDCYIRKCCEAKGINNCSECAEFPCQELKDIFSKFPEGLENLKNLKLKNKR
ncbi:DUF3795 domain-containing protein [candidate division WOR-3 bacterium]|nr:DUF3795 domain-containing protein [candidate division WOR-3 bacterium]